MVGAEHAGERVDRALVRMMPEASRATVQRWIAEGRVKLDGKICRAKQVLRVGRDRVWAIGQLGTLSDPKWEPVSITVGDMPPSN